MFINLAFVLVYFHAGCMDNRINTCSMASTPIVVTVARRLQKMQDIVIFLQDLL